MTDWKSWFNAGSKERQWEEETRYLAFKGRLEAEKAADSRTETTKEWLKREIIGSLLAQEEK